jgi:hypothetical protein
MKIKKTPTNFKIYPNEMHLYMYIVPSKFNFLFDKCVYKWQYYKTVFLPKAQKMFVVGVTKLTVVSSNNIYFKKKLLLEIIGISLAVCTFHILTSFFAFVSLQGEKNCRICLL